MIKIGFVTFPEESANKVAECYQTLPPVPDFMTLKDTFVYNNPSEEIRAFSVFEFDESKVDNADAYFKARYDAFSKVPGLTFKIEEWLQVKDALKMVEEGQFDVGTLTSQVFF